MLKYLIIVVIISFCLAHDNRVIGKYNQLILAQNPPAASFFMQQYRWPTKNTNSHNCGSSRYACMTLVKGNHWLLHGLWPFKNTGASPTFCNRGTGRKVKYQHASMNSTFKRLLISKWPTFTINKTERFLWEFEWNKHGSCVLDISRMNSVPKYFEKAVQLLDEYNVGSILKVSSIIPGQRYTLERMSAAIIKNLRINPIIKCILDQNSEEQYLVEVQICFNKKLILEDCYRSRTIGCDSNRTIIYPAIQRV